MKLRTRFVFGMGLILALAALLFGELIYRAQKDALLQGIDARLWTAAHMAKEILSPDFHDRLRNRDSLTREEYAQVVDRWNRLCRTLELEYIWSLMEVDGRLVFTSATSPSKDVRQGDHAGFFEPHSNPELYQAALATMQPQFQINNDKWGRIRTLLLPFSDRQGRPGLIGASMKTTEVDARIITILWDSLLAGTITLTLGMLLSFFFSRSLAGPLEKLAAQSREITQGNYSGVVPRTGITEIDTLAESLRELSRSIQEQIREFCQIQSNLQTEIAERKLAESGLERRTVLLDTLLDNLPVGVFMVEVPSGKPLAANSRAKELLGRGILPETDRSNLQEVYAAYRCGDNRPYPSEEMPITRGMHGERSHVDDMVVIRPDGSNVLLDIQGTPVLNKEGQPWASLVVFSDITRRKQSEAALQESEQKFRTLFESMTEGVALHEMVFDSEGKKRDYRLLSVNPAYGRHTGLDPQKACGILGSELYGTGSPPYLEEFGAVALSGKPFTFETYFPPLDKHFFISVISPKKNHFATVFEDITERKQKEKELKEKNEELARFTYTVSHDLKSPLVTIQTFLGYLEQDIRSDHTARIQKDMNFIRGAADKMSRLLDELLELSRVGRKRNPAVETTLQSVVQEALELVAGRLAARGAAVQVTEEKVLLTGDRPRLVAVFQNLVDNAVKFAGDPPHPRIEIGVESSGEEIVLFVRDNGLGIDPQYQSRIFGLFEKLEPASEGTGLGLALVRRIIETHNGRIWVESEGAGKGSTFFFTLEKTRIQNT